MKLGFGLVLLAMLPAAAQDTSVPDFGRDVLPILQKSCVGCHGP